MFEFYFFNKKQTKMKKTMLMVLLSAALLNACKKSETTAAPEEKTEAPALVAAASIDQFIKQELRTKQKFEWAAAPSDMVWSALQHSDQIMSIGYKPAGEGDINSRLQDIDINSAAWKTAREQVMQLILQEEKKTRPDLKMEQLEVWKEEFLPVINVRVENFSTVAKLRAANLVRYAEPMGYSPETLINGSLSSSGCGGNTAEPGLVDGTDYVTISPASKQSWNYTYHGIPAAWTRTTGAGAKVFIIDSGSEFDQENLGSAFNQGSSSGRTIERIVTLKRATIFGIPYGDAETPDDGCGHGTSMAGACAAPRGTDGNACGVAYNCNLVTCRAASDVFLDASRELKGVSDAYVNAGNRADVKIISMSMGTIFSSGQVTDAIRYAYGKGKLMFCAAGTSFSWTAGLVNVIFPAYLSEVNAVTGVKDNNFNSRCNVCHEGSETDFTYVMEKASNERHPLSLAMSGDAPSTVGGSSVATASTAGIAALIWSRFPTYTRQQVLDKMIQNASNYPNRNANLGWGNVNANTATL